MTWKGFAPFILASTLFGPSVLAQQTRDAAAPASGEASLAAVVQQLREQVAELREAVAEMRDESARYRQETQELRQQLRDTVAAMPQPAAVPSRGPAQPSLDAASQAPSEDRLQRLEDDLALLGGKVDDQFQTKVESGSKYRVRLSGIVLLNMFGNGGTVDSIDLPFQATPTVVGGVQGSFGGTLRQSQLRFEVFGPTLAGARTHADLDMDFAGGFPQADNGVTLGLAHLRTATLRLDWDRTSLIAGQDAPFISPLSPTSLATLAQPALSYAGNLWTWIPQVRIEHRIPVGVSSEISLQGGVLDPLSGEEPPLQFERLPQAGESSRQPAFAARAGWSSRRDGSGATLGVGAFYSRQDWRFGRTVDAWAAMGDWSLPLGKWFSLTGEFYRGRAVAGLGGGIDHSAVFFGPENVPASAVKGVDSLGGWAQVKYRATGKLEFNFAAGRDNPFAAEFRDAALGTAVYDREAVRNRSALFNFIYRPRSNLLLSTEYRRLDTYRVDGSSRSADHVNLAIGVLF